MPDKQTSIILMEGRMGLADSRLSRRRSPPLRSFSQTPMGCPLKKVRYE
jgi:hypothetical protein